VLQKDVPAEWAKLSISGTFSKLKLTKVSGRAVLENSVKIGVVGGSGKL
jgi:hypothetical protein